MKSMQRFLVLVCAGALGSSLGFAASVQEQFYWEKVALECGDYQEFFDEVSAYQGRPGCDAPRDGALGAANRTDGIYFRLHYKGRFEVTDTGHDTCNDATTTSTPPTACGEGTCKVGSECDPDVFPGAGTEATVCDRCQCCIDKDISIDPSSAQVVGCALPTCDGCTSVCDNLNSCAGGVYHCTEIVSDDVEFTVDAYKYNANDGWTVLSTPQPVLTFTEVNHAPDEGGTCPAP